MSDTPTDDDLTALIKPLWIAAKPSREAQGIRAALSCDFDDPKYQQWVSDFIPDYVWDLVDIAAQRGIDSAASPPTGLVSDRTAPNTDSTTNTAATSIPDQAMESAREIVERATYHYAGTMDEGPNYSKIDARRIEQEIAAAITKARADAIAATVQRYERMEKVVTEAARGWDRLQVMYDGQDRERAEAGECGSMHRDEFEGWLDTLVTDALAALDAAETA